MSILQFKMYKYNATKMFRKNEQRNNADLFISFVKCRCVKYKLRKSYHIYNSFCLYIKTLARLFILNITTIDKDHVRSTLYLK